MPHPTRPIDANAASRADPPVTARASAPVRERADACPGALRLHPADDGGLARLRLPGGLVTSAQAEVVAGIAERFGDGRLTLTSRGNLQVRAIDEAGARELGQLLAEAGLLPSERHERIRNIVASPAAGLDARPWVDVQAWARALDALLCAGDATAELSGRFLFALDDGRGDVAALGADVTLLARPDGLVEVIGDGASWAVVRPADAPRAAVVAAETFLTSACAGGSGAWRVRDLPPLAAQALPEAVAEALRVAGIGCVDAPSVPVPAAAPPPAPGVLVSPASAGAAVSAQAPLGALTVAQWRLLAEAAAATERNELRVTPWRGVIVPGLEPEAARVLSARLADAGLVTSPDSPWYGVSACTGRPGCVKARTDVRAHAAAATRGSVAGPGALPVHWSGCERRCGRPVGAHVDVVARDDGTAYTVTVDDRRTTVRAGDAAQAAAAVAEGRTATVTGRQR